MQIKLLEDCNGALKGSLIECDEVTGVDLISKKVAEIDETKVKEVELQVKDIVQKSLESVVDKKINKGNKIMENYVIGKMFQDIAKKTISGNSETGSAADGGAVVFTGLAELQPIVMQQSQVYNKCRKIALSKNANAMKVPISVSDYVIKGTAPVVVNVAEGIANTPTKIQFGSRTLSLVKSAIYVPVTEELLEDQQAMDSWVRAEMVGKMANVLDYEVLLGSAAGYTGIKGDTGYTLTQSISATPTLNELVLLTLKVHPTMNPEFYTSATMWALIVNTLATEKNVALQNIDVANRTLLGKKVNIVPCLGATDLILADLSGFAVIESPLGDRLQVSNEVRFLEGEIVFKLTHRGAGAGVFASKATGDSVNVSYAVQKA